MRACSSTSCASASAGRCERSRSFSQASSRAAVAAPADRDAAQAEQATGLVTGQVQQLPAHRGRERAQASNSEPLQRLGQAAQRAPRAAYQQQPQQHGRHRHHRAAGHLLHPLRRDRASPAPRPAPAGPARPAPRAAPGRHGRHRTPAQGRTAAANSRQPRAAGSVQNRGCWSGGWSRTRRCAAGSRGGVSAMSEGAVARIESKSAHCAAAPACSSAYVLLHLGRPPRQQIPSLVRPVFRADERAGQALHGQCRSSTSACGQPTSPAAWRTPRCCMRAGHPERRRSRARSSDGMAQISRRDRGRPLRVEARSGGRAPEHRGAADRAGRHRRQAPAHRPQPQRPGRHRCAAVAARRDRRAVGCC